MSGRIERLSAIQERRLIEFREEWRGVGLSCEPADFEAGDKILKGFYRRLGKPEPMILHFSSPALCEMAVNTLFPALKDTGTSQLRSQLDSQLDSQIDSQLRSQLGSQLDSQLDSQIDSQLRSHLRSQLNSQINSQLRSQLDSHLHSQLSSQLLGGGVRPYFIFNRWGGQHWCAFEAFYLFGREIGATYPPDTDALLDEWATLARSVGWWAAWDGFCIVSDRTRQVHFDEAGRLHCETGQAVAYADGWGVHSWHGLRIPDDHAWIITDRSNLTPDAIDAEPNAELRRVMLEVIGFEAYVEARGARVIAEDEVFGRPRRLLEMFVRGEPIRVLDVWNGSLEQDGTRRRFFLGAVAGADTPHAAVAASYGIDPVVYDEGVRT